MTKIEKGLYGLILAGGYSRRMRQDKALLQFHGKPQIEHIYNLLQKHCSKVFLSKRKDQKTYDGLPFIDDTQKFCNTGPLGGILSAMKAYPGASWLVMACDLPFVTKETLATLLENRHQTKVATAFKSSHDDLPEPLCAIWEAGYYSKILEFLKKGIHCPRKVLTHSDTYLLEQTNPQWLDNINNPQEFKQWKNSYTTS